MKRKLQIGDPVSWCGKRGKIESFNSTRKVAFVRFSKATLFLPIRELCRLVKKKKKKLKRGLRVAYIEIDDNGNYVNTWSSKPWPGIRAVKFVEVIEE